MGLENFAEEMLEEKYINELTVRQLNEAVGMALKAKFYDYSSILYLEIDSSIVRSILTTMDKVPLALYHTRDRKLIRIHKDGSFQEWNPCADMQLAVEIIRSNSIGVVPQTVETVSGQEVVSWSTYPTGSDHVRNYTAAGPTMQIAAMRHLIANKLGLKIYSIVDEENGDVESCNAITF